MLHCSTKLLDDFCETEDFSSVNDDESWDVLAINGLKNQVHFDKTALSNKRRQAVYLSPYAVERDICKYNLDDIIMPSVSFADEQEFERSVKHRDQNSNFISGSSDHHAVIFPAPVTKRCSEEEEEAEVVASLKGHSSVKIVNKSSVKSNRISLENVSSQVDVNRIQDESGVVSDKRSDKESSDVVVNCVDSEDPYNMHNLQDSLPKLKVTTPACLHNETCGAFIAYTESEDAQSSWQPLSRRCSLQSDCTSMGDSDHDASMCSVDSTMTISSVESLPKVFYDPKVHCACRLTAVSVPPRRHGLPVNAQNMSCSVTSTNCYIHAKTPTESRDNQLRCSGSQSDVLHVSNVKTPELKSASGLSLSASSKARNSTRAQQITSRAMIKLDFPSPAKSTPASSIHPRSTPVNGRVGSHELVGLYNPLCGKRVRSSKNSVMREDVICSKRQCQRSVTPQIGKSDSEPRLYVKPNKSSPKTNDFQSRLSGALLGSGSSVPKDHRLGISRTTPTLRMSSWGTGFESCLSSAHRRSSPLNRNVFSVLPESKRRSCSPLDSNSGSMEVDGQSRNGKRTRSCVEKVSSRKPPLFSPPSAKRNPLLQKFLNVPAVTAANVIEYSDDQLEAVTLKNTILNRGKRQKNESKTNTEPTSTTNQSASRPPSRLKWKADLVMVESEIHSSPVTTSSAKAKKSILHLRSHDSIQTAT